MIQPMPHWSWEDLETILIARAPLAKQPVVQLMLTRLKDDAERLDPRSVLLEVLAVGAISLGFDPADQTEGGEMH